MHIGIALNNIAIKAYSYMHCMQVRVHTTYGIISLVQFLQNDGFLP